jgi:hypothetical protein
MTRSFGLIGLAVFALVACGGGGGGGTAAPPPTIPTPIPTATPINSVSQSVSLTTTGPQSSTFMLPSLSDAVTFPSASVATTVTSTFSTTQPGSTPAIQNLKRRPRSIGASPIAAIAFQCVTPAANTSLSAYPSFVLSVPLPLAPAGSFSYVAFFDAANAAAGLDDG